MRMTEEEYSKKQLALSEGLHPTLAGILTHKAYNDAHAWGYEEVFNTLYGLVIEFQPINDLLKGIR